MIMASNTIWLNRNITFNILFHNVTEDSTGERADLLFMDVSCYLTAPILERGQICDNQKHMKLLASFSRFHPTFVTSNSRKWKPRSHVFRCTKKQQRAGHQPRNKAMGMMLWKCQLVHLQAHLLHRTRNSAIIAWVSSAVASLVP